MGELSIYRNANDFIFITPQYDETYNQSVIKQILKAWKNGGNLDAFGRVWVDTCYLPQILRTNATNAKYLVGKLSDKFVLEFDGKKFVRGTEIGRLIDMGIQSADTRSKEKNLRVSRDVYNAIVDSEAAQLLRADYMEHNKNDKKKLKKKRIKKYNIVRDELTNEVLDENNCQFSHIRSWSLYPELATNIDNGHIVNEQIHNIITQRGINDEEELLILCIEMGWNTSWYDSYKEMFG